MFVMKFGGTSVAKTESVAAIKELVQRGLAKQPILVVSALSGITDLLVKLSSSVLENEQENLFGLIFAKHDDWIQRIFVDDEVSKEAAFSVVNGYLSELRQLLHGHSFINQLQLHDSIASFGERMSSA
ncbi:MAG: hypothetical protein EKK57_08265, partial [Proteobacteria bacterium]